MKLFFMLLLTYLVLYVVLWLHEVGHSFFYWKYGCKKNFLMVTVKPYLFFSTPSPVDEKKYESLTGKQRLMCNYGGIAGNLCCAVVAFVPTVLLRIGGGWPALVLWLFITLHLAEAVSYLVIGNLYPVSDMAAIAEERPGLRPVNLLIGTALSAVYTAALVHVPEDFRIFLLIVNLTVVFGMGAGRVMFTLLHRRNTK